MKIEEFIIKANQIHSNKYDYSLFEYINCKTKSKIICKIHNKVFFKNPDKHLNAKQGCFECSKIKIGNSLRSNYNEFVHKAKSIHGDLYD